MVGFVKTDVDVVLARPHAPGLLGTSQLSTDGLSHYEAFPWRTWILFKATERLALVWQYYSGKCY